MKKISFGNHLWHQTNSRNEILQKELTRLKLTTLLPSNTADEMEHLFLVDKFTKAFMIFKIVDFNMRLSAECILFINKSKIKNVDFIEEGSQIARLIWPNLDQFVEIEAGKINSPSGYCFKLAGWTNHGRNDRGNFIYSNP